MQVCSLLGNEPTANEECLVMGPSATLAPGVTAKSCTKVGPLNRTGSAKDRLLSVNKDIMTPTGSSTDSFTHGPSWKIPP